VTAVKPSSYAPKNYTAYSPHTGSFAVGAYKPYPGPSSNNVGGLGSGSNGGCWDLVPLSPPPPAYSVVENERQKERQQERLPQRESSGSSVYGAQDDEYGAGGQPDRMSILSFINYYEYYRPAEKN